MRDEVSDGGPDAESSGALPMDSDLEVEGRSGRQRPAHLRWRYLGLVWVGGALGTSARYLLGRALPTLDHVPLPTLLVNTAGAFLLGALLAGLSKPGSDQGHRRTLRLFAGTGFLGGFTTYSALALDTAGLLGGGRVGHAVAYGLVTLVIGAVASVAGIAVGNRAATPGARR